MDPLSVAASVAGLVSICLRAAAGLDALWTRFEHAQVTIMALTSQCRAISSGFSRLEVLLRESGTIRHRPELLLTLETTLSGSEVVLTCLQNAIDNMTESSDGKRKTWIQKLRVKASILWNEDEMDRYSLLLQGQQSTISFLIQLLQVLVCRSVVPQSKRH